MLSIQNLDMHYDNGTTHVLRDISFSCRPGEILAFIGPSGCGKSSLLNILAGNIKDYSGIIRLNDGEIDHKRMNIGLIAQDYGLLPWKTVYGNIILPLKIKQLTLSDYKERIAYVMAQLQIDQLKNRYPNQLSGGQKQRVAIAKTFIMNQDLLLMDEPFSALDAITREQTQQLFFDTWAEQKPITLFVTHSIEEAVFLGKQIVILAPAPGRIIRVMENPTFGMEDVRSSAEFHAMCTEVREIIRAEW